MLGISRWRNSSYRIVLLSACLSTRNLPSYAVVEEKVPDKHWGAKYHFGHHTPPRGGHLSRQCSNMSSAHFPGESHGSELRKCLITSQKKLGGEGNHGREWGRKGRKVGMGWVRFLHSTAPHCGAEILEVGMRHRLVGGEALRRETYEETLKLIVSCRGWPNKILHRKKKIILSRRYFNQAGHVTQNNFIFCVGSPCSTPEYRWGWK